MEIKLNNLIQIAMSAGGQASEGQGAGLMGMLPMILIVVVIYFFMIRPQTKKAKQQKEMISALKKGDKVITIGGIHGTISQVKDGSFLVQIAAGTEIEIDRGSVSVVVKSNTEA